MSIDLDSFRHAVRDGVARAAAVVGLGGIALIHLLDLPGKFSEVPYMAWLYVALIAGSIVLAGALIRGSDPRAWAAAGGLALTVVVAYALSRTTGLPQSSGDIGNWSEPLGIASVFVEGSVAALSGAVLLERAGGLAPAIGRGAPRASRAPA